MDDKQSRGGAKTPPILLIFAMCLGLYVGSYYALLKPRLFVSEAHLGMVIDGYREVDYSWGGQVSHAVFAPVHWLDHKMRSSYWNDASDDLSSLTQ